MLEFLKDKLPKYKIFLLVLIGLISCLFLVLIVSGIVGIINKIKEGHYIGAGLTYKNVISVRGEGRVYTKPDIALADLSVVSEGYQIKDVQEDNSKKMNKVIKFLKDFGVEEKDIKTTNYQIYPRYIYEEKKSPRIGSYEITQTLEVKVRNLDKIGEILEKSVNNGVNQVTSLHFQLDNDKEVKDQARKLAIDEAKEKAKRLASLMGVKLGAISGYDEATSFDYPVYREYGLGGGEAPQIQAGENEIVVDVTLIYEID
jgi:hypothetical protein